MQWLKLEVRVKREHATAVESLMDSQGALSITMMDESDDPVLEPGVGETPLWPGVVISGLFEADTPVGPLKAVMSLAPGVRPGGIDSSTIEDRDWEAAYLEHAAPMRFGESLWIVPAGLQAPEPDATVIRLDAGLAFGSGTHPTTRLCLEWLESQELRGRTVIDFGCGSGVLGIAAALRGARDVICVDNDPQALTATRDNAARNGVPERITALDPAEFGGREAGVIVANILSGTLIGLAPLLCGSLQACGQIALSGILEEQAAEVVSAYERWIEGMEHRGLEGWVLLSGTKRQAS